MHLWPELAYMPVLNHWPDRPEPFTPERSQVLAWIQDRYHCDLHVAHKIFDSARNKGVLVFDPETRIWSGKKGGRR